MKGVSVKSVQMKPFSLFFLTLQVVKYAPAVLGEVKLNQQHFKPHKPQAAKFTSNFFPQTFLNHIFKI